jgi:hypothetical protein
MVVIGGKSVHTECWLRAHLENVQLEDWEVVKTGLREVGFEN